MSYTEKDLSEWFQKVKKYNLKEKYATEEPKRGDIWTMDFGLTVGSEIQRIRPVVIISSSIVNEKTNTLLVAPITRRTNSKVSSELNFHFLLSAEYFEWGSKKVNGVVKTEAITTLSKGRIGRRIARLNDLGIDKMTLLAGKMLHFHEPISPKDESGKRDQY